jgi:DNA-binding GntR family transcriptional regulator
MSKPTRSTADQKIYDHVHEAIHDHRLLPGTKLPEDSLGLVFGVSRTVVRRALDRLAHEHLVEIRPHRTTRVARPTPKQAQDVFGARIVIEMDTVRAAADQASEADLTALRTLEADEHRAAEADDRRSWIALSGQYHLAIRPPGAVPGRCPWRDHRCDCGGRRPTRGRADAGSSGGLP